MCPVLAPSPTAQNVELGQSSVLRPRVIVLLPGGTTKPKMAPPQLPTRVLALLAVLQTLAGCPATAEGPTDDTDDDGATVAGSTGLTSDDGPDSTSTSADANEADLREEAEAACADYCAAMLECAAEDVCGEGVCDTTVDYVVALGRECVEAHSAWATCLRELPCEEWDAAAENPCVDESEAFGFTCGLI